MQADNGVDCVVQRIPKQRVQVGRADETQRLAVGNAREHDATAGAQQALLGEDGVEGSVSRLNGGIVYVQLSRGAGQKLAVQVPHGIPPL
nr:hypothetical protein [Olsenella urininfantis]